MNELLLFNSYQMASRGRHESKPKSREGGGISRHGHGHGCWLFFEWQRSREVKIFDVNNHHQSWSTNEGIGKRSSGIMGLFRYGAKQIIGFLLTATSKWHSSRTINGLWSLPFIELKACLLPFRVWSSIGDLGLFPQKVSYRVPLCKNSSSPTSRSMPCGSNESHWPPLSMWWGCDEIGAITEFLCRGK